MLRVEEHRLTQRQIELIQQAVEHMLETTVAMESDADQAAEDLLETLNTKIHGGVQVVIVRYEEE